MEYRSLGPPLDRLFEIRFEYLFSAVVVALWDGFDFGYRLEFAPVQAVRATTIDAAQFPGRPPAGVSEVVDSAWLRELASQVVDPVADFMAKSHHYFLLGFDDVLEIAAFDVAVVPDVAQPARTTE